MSSWRINFVWALNSINKAEPLFPRRISMQRNFSACDATFNCFYIPSLYFAFIQAHHLTISKRESQQAGGPCFLTVKIPKKNITKSTERRPRVLSYFSPPFSPLCLSPHVVMHINLRSSFFWPRQCSVLQPITSPRALREG